MTKQTYRIGEVASAVGVSVDTLRFYERERLLPPAVRSTGGARRYTESIVDRVKFIRKAQNVGLTLKDVRVLVDLRQRPTRAGCQRTRAVLADRIQDLEQRMQELRDFQISLSAHLQACDETLAADDSRDCPALSALERGAGQGVTQ